METQVFYLVDAHVEFLKAMANFRDRHGVHTGKNMLVAKSEGRSGFRFADRMQQKCTFGFQ